MNETEKFAKMIANTKNEDAKIILAFMHGLRIGAKTPA